MHEYTLVFAVGEDAPNKSLDSIFYCPNCGTVKHAYAHGGGMTSPNYPVFFALGCRYGQATEPECRSIADVLTNARIAADRDAVLGPSGFVHREDE